MTIDTKPCPNRSQNGMCTHKDWKNRPCAIDEGRDDLCPLKFQPEKVEEEDCGER